MTTTNAPVPASVSVSVSITVLNTSLTGVYNSNSVIDDKKVKTVTTEILVIPTDSPKGGMTITELIDGVNQMIKDFSDSSEQVNRDDVQKKIDLVSSGGVLNKIKVELRQIFLYRKQVETYEPKPDGTYDIPPTKTEKSLEYAVNFIITSEITKSTVFNINTISLAVWNTSRPKIINRMQLGDIDNLLNN